MFVRIYSFLFILHCFCVGSLADIIQIDGMSVWLHLWHFVNICINYIDLFRFVGGNCPAPRLRAASSTKLWRLLRTFRRSDMAVNFSDLEPILEILQLNSLFSTKPPRETSTLDPGSTIRISFFCRFVIYLYIFKYTYIYIYIYI